MFTRNKIYLILMLLMIGLFFMPLPIPVENIEGANNPNQYIHGGLYWTSISKQIQLQNYIPLSLFIPFIFIGAILNNSQRKKR